MKRSFLVFCIVALISLLIASTKAVAEDTTAPAVTVSEAAKDPAVGQVAQPDDVAEMRQEIKTLTALLAAQQTQPVSPAPSSPATQTLAAQPPATTMTQVADKALLVANERIDQILNATGNLVGQLSKVVQEVAPQIWHIMIKQQYVKAISGLVLPLALLGVIITYMVAMNTKFWKKPDDERDGSDAATARIALCWVVPTILSLAFATWSAFALSNSICYAVNPEYYAVRDIMVMITNPESLLENGGQQQQRR